MVYLSAHLQSNVPSMAAWLFVPELVNHPGRTLYPMTAIASMALSARGWKRPGKESHVLFPKDLSNITHIEQILAGPWERKLRF